MYAWKHGGTAAAERTHWAAWLGLTATLVLAAIVLRIPVNPGLPSDSLDPSWAGVVFHGLLDGKVFGRDMIYMYGPLSFLVTHLFHPALHAIDVAYAILVVGGGMVAICLLLRDSALPWFAIFAIASLLPLPVLYETNLLLLPFLAGLLRGAPSRAAQATAFLLVVLAAIAAFAKFSTFMAAMAVLPLVDLFLLWRQRRWPLLTPVYLLAFVSAHRVAGQPLDALDEFVRTSMEFSRGYPLDHATPGNWPERIGFLLLAIALLGLAVSTLERYRSRDAMTRSLLGIGVLGIGCFITWKAGFLRHDGHAVIAWTVITVLAVASLAPIARGRLRRTVLLGLLLAGIAAQWFSTQHHFRLGGAGGNPLSALRWVVESREWEVTSALRLLGDPDALHERWEQQLEQTHEEIVQRYRLPTLEGTVDVIGGPSYIAIASGLTLDPRPLIAGHPAMTANLLSANLGHLESETRPDWLLWRAESIDGRYPSMDDGILWPAILEHYEHVDETRHFLVMRRRSERRPLTLTPLPTVFLQTDRWARLPVHEQPLWAKVAIRTTFVEKVVGFLWRPPLVALDVAFDDGRRATFAMPRNLAAQGFLFSPLVNDLGDLQMLASGDLSRDDAPPRPVRVRIKLEWLGDHAYELPAHLQLFALEQQER